MASFGGVVKNTEDPQLPPDADPLSTVSWDNDAMFGQALHCSRGIYMLIFDNLEITRCYNRETLPVVKSVALRCWKQIR
jgi:hypothetical protein